ncbi:MAG: hypothetical protein QOE29_206 [Gaiellaceae bacterium]|nr:hypothetical protein [Gaiellaceae bacterium]
MSWTRRELLARGLAVGAGLAYAPAASARDPRLRSLARDLRGPVLSPGSAAYAQARIPENARYAGIHPLAVAQPLDAHDVATVVRWSAKTGVPIVARSGGHSYAGYSTSHGVVVDLSRMRSVQSLAGGRASVGAGVRLGVLYDRLAAAGRALPAGSCPSVGIGGLALGGGFGLASRAWGLTCDRLAAVDIVTADGSILTADAQHHTDLFWASRGGGGGNFGIATRFVFRTLPVPQQGSYFIATWPWAQAEEVLDRFLSWAPHAPDGLGAICRLATGVTTPSVQVFGQFLGTAAQLNALLAGLVTGLAPQALKVADASWLDLLRRWAGCLGKELTACSQPVSQSFAGGSDYLTAPLSAAGLQACRAAIEARQAGHQGGALLFDAYGGAIGRVKPAATAFVHRNVIASCQEFALGEPVAARAWVRATRASLRPHVSGFAYQNYIDPDLASWRHAYYGANLQRLTKVKRRYDPKNRFHFAQSIPLHL